MEQKNKEGIRNVTVTIYEWLSIAGLKFGDVTKIPLAISLVQEEFDEMKEAIQNKDKNELLDSFADLMFTTCNVLFYSGITPQEANKKFEQVVASNYSKFCQTREEAQEAVDAYANGTHFTKKGIRIPTHVVVTGNSVYPFVVKNLESGKLLKGLAYKDPNQF